MQYANTDTLNLSFECAKAFSNVSGIGCTVSDTRGNILSENGYGCNTCEICSAANIKKDKCIQTQNYGMAQAERFGGKYIYFCHMGLTCFVSPIFGKEGDGTKITAGPLLMVDREEYIEYELEQMPNLTSASKKNVINILNKLPVVPVEKVESLSTMLFMQTGFLNNMYETSRMLDKQSDDQLQSQISGFIEQFKFEQNTVPYPFDTENALLASVSDGNKAQAQKLLNELFGYIFFVNGGNIATAKARINELLVLISRASINSGADVKSTLQTTQDYLIVMPTLNTIDALCSWLAGVTNNFISSIFNYADVKHVNVMRKADLYMRENCTRKILLEEVAKEVYLSPTYFSRIFKREKGESFTKYINRLRIDKSKPLLLKQELRMSDIAQTMGFEDQSYYTKVFKSIVGVSPLAYRQSKGRI